MAAFRAVAVDGAAGLHGVDLKVAVEFADEGRVGVGKHKARERTYAPEYSACPASSEYTHTAATASDTAINGKSAAKSADTAASIANAAEEIEDPWQIS